MSTRAQGRAARPGVGELEGAVVDARRRGGQSQRPGSVRTTSAAAPSRALQLRALDRALPGVRARSREPLARGRAPPGRRRARGADRGGAAAASTSSRSTTRPGRWSSTCSGSVRARRRSRPGPPGSRCSASSSPRLAGFRPPLAPDPFESLVTSITAQQISLRAASAIRSRFIERLGDPVGPRLCVPDARAGRGATEEQSSSSSASRAARRSTWSGSRAPPLDLDALAALADDEIRARLVAAARDRRLDGRMVPRAAPRAADGVARRRPRPAPGGRSLLRFGRARARPAPRSVPEPVGPLPADRLAHAMNVRPATAADEAALRELWEEFEAEVPEPEGFSPDTWEEDWARAREAIDAGAVFLAEDDEGPVGLLEARRGRRRAAGTSRRCTCGPGAAAGRREGAARARARAPPRAAGATHVSLGVLVTNTRRRDGLAAARLRAGRARAGAAARRARRGGSATRPSAPRVPRRTSRPTTAPRSSARSRSSCRGSTAPTSATPTGGWIRISDPLLDADRDAQARFARDLSDRLGAVVVALALERGAVVRFRLYERGRMVDEYLSVPSFYGAARTRRRARARGEPDARRAAHRRRPRRGAAGRAHRCDARRPAAGRRALRGRRPDDGPRALTMDGAVIETEELSRRLGEVAVLDVRRAEEYDGIARRPLRPAPGAHPGRA